MARGGKLVASVAENISDDAAKAIRKEAQKKITKEVAENTDDVLKASLKEARAEKLIPNAEAAERGKAIKKMRSAKMGGFDNVQDMTKEMTRQRTLPDTGPSRVVNNSAERAKGYSSAFNGSHVDDYQMKNRVDEKTLLEKDRQARLKDKLSSKHSDSKAYAEKKVQRAQKEAAEAKKQTAKDLLSRKNIQKGVGLGVGGYLVLNMFDKGGQMSNAELYGQQQQYGSY